MHTLIHLYLPPISSHAQPQILWARVDLVWVYCGLTVGA